MTDSEFIRQEAPKLPPTPDECWSPEGALWNKEGVSRTKPLVEVLRAEKEAREGFASREDAIAKWKAAIR